jgi:hypothetical protein
VNRSAVFPPVLLFNLTVLPYLGSLNPLIRTLLLCLCVTALVTWILMPRLPAFLQEMAVSAAPGASRTTQKTDRIAPENDPKEVGG